MSARKKGMSIFAVGILLCIIAGVAAYLLHPRLERWTVYYGEAEPFSTFAPYDLVVFDSDRYPDFTARQRGKPIVLGYLSTAEAESYRPYTEAMDTLDVALKAKGEGIPANAIDIRKAAWQEYFVQSLVPYVLEKGFDGIMLDTIDTALYLEERYPDRFPGMREAAIRLVKEVRAEYPHAVLMLNRGFPILDAVAKDVDYLLAESIYVQHDKGRQESRYFPPEVYAEHVAALKAAQAENPALKVVTLDYWKPEDRAAIRAIYATQRRHGFIPHVTTVDLMHHHREPL